jgi:hypothetical protein
VSCTGEYEAHFEGEQGKGLVWISAVFIKMILTYATELYEQNHGRLLQIISSLVDI